MNILVTGGTGFLGSRLIPQLVKGGHTISALTRSNSSHDTLRALGATPVEGDLEGFKPLSLPPIDAVVHAAALFRFAGPRVPYFQTNLTGTTALLEAAKQAGATTFVYVSAAGIVMDDRGSSVLGVDESAPTHPNSFSGYIASKSRGEAAVLEANGPDFRTIALRPPAIWGPGDSFSRALPHALKSGQFSFVDRGEYPFATCHVDNVIEAIQCALERGTGGRAYFVNDQETQTFRDFVTMIGSLQGLPTDQVSSVPYRIAFGLGRLMEFFAAITFRKSDPPISRSMVRMIGRPFTTNDAAARLELGYIGRVSRLAGKQSYGNPSTTGV